MKSKVQDIISPPEIREKIQSFKDLPKDVIKELIVALQNPKFKTFVNSKGEPGRINIFSKENNMRYVFDRDFNLLGEWPYLRGAVPGDHLNTADPDSPSKAGATTMSGHGVFGKPEKSPEIWKEYKTPFTPIIYNKFGYTGIGSHGTYEGEFVDRTKRLYSSESANRLISYGCLNNPKCKLEKLPDRQGDSVFITPESKDIVEKLKYIKRNKLKVGEEVPINWKEIIASLDK